MTQTPSTLADAREQFLSLVADVRPELHRLLRAAHRFGHRRRRTSCKTTLAKAFYALSLLVEIPPLRPWLFKIAHKRRRSIS